jgi:hypothetical protein
VTRRHHDSAALVALRRPPPPRRGGAIGRSSIVATLEGKSLCITPFGLYLAAASRDTVTARRAWETPSCYCGQHGLDWFGAPTSPLGRPARLMDSLDPGRMPRPRDAPPAAGPTASAGRERAAGAAHPRGLLASRLRRDCPQSCRDGRHEAGLSPAGGLPPDSGNRAGAGRSDRPGRRPGRSGCRPRPGWRHVGPQRALLGWVLDRSPECSRACGVTP